MLSKNIDKSMSKKNSELNQSFQICDLNARLHIEVPN